MAKKVIVLGGGVGGMSAAHELIERGFDVEVYERKAIPGGKARSMAVPQSGTLGRADWPGEHGFRFFPGFYRHLPHTMSRIKPKPCDVNLTGTKEFQIAQDSKPGIMLPAHFPLSPGDLWKDLSTLFTTAWPVTPADATFFSKKLLDLLASCEERRFGEYEFKTWWDYSEAASRSAEYQKFCAEGLTRNLVACRADKISARTAGYILLQLMFDLATPGVQMDRVLKGPTNPEWIDQWLTYLRSKNVSYTTDATVARFNWLNGQIDSVDVSIGGKPAQQVKGDYYVSALPGDVMRTLVTKDMAQAEPRLAKLQNLQFGWMTGIQLYLNKPMTGVVGHTLYIDSPWSLTSIAQQQFWSDAQVSTMGNGKAVDILSVCISEWDSIGTVNKKMAKGCTKAEIEDEVLQQLMRHLNSPQKTQLDPNDVEARNLDPAIEFGITGVVVGNSEPLLINTAGSWSDRPDAVTSIPNLFLASDYVRTFTDLATMEGANEAARRAVNGIIDVSGVPAAKCDVWPLKEPLSFALLKVADQWRYNHGLPFFRDAKPAEKLATLAWRGEHAAQVLVNRLGAAVFRDRTVATNVGRTMRGR